MRRKERRGLRCAVVVAGAVTLLAALGAPATPADGAGPDPVIESRDQAVAFQQNVEHNGEAVATSLQPPLAKKWQVRVPAPGNVWQVPSAPVVADGRVFVTQISWEPETSLVYAFDLYSGEPLWGPVPIGGDRGLRAGLTYDAGTLFAINNVGDVFAFDAATGTTLWKRATGSWDWDTPPTASDGTLYIGAGSAVLALRASDGGELWRWLSTTGGSQSSPAVSDGLVIVSYARPQVHALDAQTGKEIWHHDGSYWGGGGRTATVRDHRVYVRSGLEQPMPVLDLASGAHTGAFDSWQPPAFDDETMYTTPAADYAMPRHTCCLLTAVDRASGSTRWTFDPGEGPGAPLVANGTVYIAAWEGDVYALDAKTGSVVFHDNVGEYIKAPDEHNASGPLTGMAIGGGYLVVPSMNQLSAYGPAEAAVSVNAESVVFGRQPVGTVGPSARLRVTASGGSAVDVSSITVDGAGSDHVRVVSDNCTERTLAPAQGCSVDIAAAPTSAGEFAAAVSIATSTGDQQVQLTGSGHTEETTPPRPQPTNSASEEPDPQTDPTPAPTEGSPACPAGAVPDGGFRDVADDNIHKQAIDCVTWWGIARGISSERYAPSITVTRAQMASFIAQLILRSGGNLPEQDNDHFDDDDSSVHESSINRLASAGIVSGVGPRRYAPSDPLTRGQMASLLVRAYTYRSGTALSASRDHFADDDGTTHEPAINRAAEARFTNGTAPGVYSPWASVTRAHMASFLRSVLDVLVDEGKTAPPA